MRKRFRYSLCNRNAWIVLGAVLAMALGGACVKAAEESMPSFDEVADLVRSNLAGASAVEIDRLAVAGLLKELAPRVTLVGTNEEVHPSLPLPGVLECTIYRESVGYWRLGRLDSGTASQFRDQYRSVRATNTLSGLVLDLRSAGGNDYDAAAAIADLFHSEEMPLMNWGEGLKRSTQKDDAIPLPVAVLLGGETGGSAEALAAVLKETGVALLIGSSTAGTAGVQQSFPLSGGGFLRITVGNIQLGLSAQILPMTGLQPDVVVAEEPPRGQTLLIAGNGTLSSNREPDAVAESVSPVRSSSRMNEADLVRHWRGERVDPDDDEPSEQDLVAQLNDPALQRAIDLMEGLAILRSWQR